MCKGSLYAAYATPGVGYCCDSCGGGTGMYPARSGSGPLGGYAALGGMQDDVAGGVENVPFVGTMRGHARGVSPEMNSRHAAPRGGADAGGIGCVGSACVALAAEAVTVCVGGGVSI